jgi:hypothetical protein
VVHVPPLRRCWARLLVVTALLVPWLAGSSLARPAGAAGPVPGVQQALDAMVSQAGRFGIDPTMVGVAVLDLQDGTSWSVHGDTKLSFMSSAKLPWVAFATAATGVDANQPDAHALFRWSDNVAAGRYIVRSGGIDNLANWYRAVGMDSSCTKTWGYNGLYASTACPAVLGRYTNHSTAKDMNRLLAAVWDGTLPGLDAAERAALLQWSTWSLDAWAADGDGTITGYLPGTLWPTAHHKVGWYWGNGYSDASDTGIIELPDGRAYAISLAAHGGSSSATQAEFLAQTSCEVYRAYSGHAGWVCPARPADDATPSGAAATFTAAGPRRILDTRIDGLRMAAGSTHTLALPAELTGGRDVVAVAATLTVVAPDADGYLTAWSGRGPLPFVANVNYTRHDHATATSAIIGLGGDGRLALTTTAEADIVVDVTGLFTAEDSGSRLQLLPSPTRLVDTRSSTALDGGTPRQVPIGGRAGISPSATSVVVSLTTTGGAGPGWLAAYAGRGGWPGTSTLNYGGAAVQTTTVIVPLDAGGVMELLSTTRVDVIVDVIGWFDPSSTGLSYRPVDPFRAYDSRQTGGALVRHERRAASVGDGEVAAVWANTTMVDTGGEGYALLQGGDQHGYASNQYAYPGWTKNFGVLSGAAGGTVVEAAGVIGTFHWVLDISGFFVST